MSIDLFDSFLRCELMIYRTLGNKCFFKLIFEDISGKKKEQIILELILDHQKCLEHE